MITNNRNPHNTPHSTPEHTTVQKWSVASRIFHWGSVILLGVTWLMIALYDNLDNALYIGLHKAFGISLLLWMIARIINRLLTKSPPDVTHTPTKVIPAWQNKIAHLTHLALYALLIAMPIAGLLMSVYAGRGVSMFGLFEIPAFVSPDRDMARFFNNLHTGVIWTLILLFTGLHIAAALYHQFVLKDKVIKRMM